MSLESVRQIIERNKNGGESNIMGILEEIQSKHGYLPEEALREVAETTKRSLVDIYGIATFYRAFSLQPRGRHLVSVCLGTACHVRGTQRVAEKFKQELGILPGETTKDRIFTYETVNCLGACALGPIVVVDGKYYSNVKTSMVKNIIEKTLEEPKPVQIAADQAIFPIEVSCSHCNHTMMDAENQIDGYPSIKVTISFDRNHGSLRLSSLYGSYNTQSDYKIPPDKVINIFCPHCHAELSSGIICLECGAPMVPLIVQGGGIVQFCSRKGCKGHMLDLSGVNL